MTTKITITYGDAELVTTGEYIAEGVAMRIKRGVLTNGVYLPARFVIERIEQDGTDVTEHYRQFRAIPLLEEMAREVVEDS